MSKELIPTAATAQNTIVLGKTRAGKSSKMRLIVEGLLEHDKPACIIDPKGDWWGIKSSADGKKAGYPLIIFGGEHSDVPITAHSGANIAELIATGNRPCLIDLGGWMVAERTRFFIDFASTLFKLTKGARWLVIDECHNFAPKGRLFDPEAAKMLHWANRLASEGSGKGLTLLSASQRPQKVHNDYLTSHETLIACRVIHKADRDALKDWIDGCADPAAGKEMVATLADMKRSDAWVWSPEVGFGPARITFPMFKTYDSFKPQGADAPATLKGWASVNLEEVKARLATVVEQAKENDPKALKALVAQLRAELAKKAPAAAPTIVGRPDPAALADARAQGREEGYLVGHHVASGLYPIAIKYYLDHIPGLLQQLRNGLEGSASEGAGMVQAQDFAEERAGFVGIGGEKILAKLKRQGQTPLAPNAPAPPELARDEIDAAPVPIKRGGGWPIGERVAIAKPIAIDSSLGRAKQEVLDNLAWMESVGRSPVGKETIAFLAGASPNSSGYQNNMGALRSAGLIEYPAGGQAALTDAGRKLANPPARMPNSEALQSAVLAKLKGGALRLILEKLLDGKQRSKEELAREVGASPNSSGFQNNMGRLRSLGFITYPVPGQVAVAETMFI